MKRVEKEPRDEQNQKPTTTLSLEHQEEGRKLSEVKVSWQKLKLGQGQLAEADTTARVMSQEEMEPLPKAPLKQRRRGENTLISCFSPRAHV